MAIILIVTGISSANSFSLGTGANNLPPPTRYCKFMLRFCLVGDFGLGNNKHGGEWRWASLMLFGLMGLLAMIGPVVHDKDVKPYSDCLIGSSLYRRLKKHINRRHSNK